MGIEFDPTNKYILITSPTTELSALEIYSAVMDWCDSQEGMAHTVPMQAVGKFDMGGGVYSDSIFQLINGWKLKFWSTTEHFKVTGTLLPETPTISRHVTPADVEYQVATQGTVIPDVAEWTQIEKNGIISDVNTIQAKTDNIPSDLNNVPTDLELDAKHGSGSWEGATPTQVWSHPQRNLTTREIAGHPENIASEGTLGEIKGTTFQTDADSLKKIKEAIEELQAREVKIKPKLSATI